MQIKKILIANRGEIACRIMRTAKAMGIDTVAIYSAVDITARHVQLADAAFCVGPAPSCESYLNIEKIITIAKEAKVDAIHPGYGFLSENTLFAKACRDNHIIFIGPSEQAIAAMGSKSMAKAITAKAKVPLIPGYHGESQEENILLAEAKKIGFPVMLKAVAGGGGKGMRVVYSAKEFSDALATTRREAKASFANDAMLIEKYITNPRHIEMQIFADNHGHCVHLFERECSIQRRHQKVLEEAPAIHLSESVRSAMAEAAIMAAKAIDYVGAGTVEFLLDGENNFYFMEMNTRLQVEHPVTEMIVQQDLVEWQIRVAADEALPLRQKDIKKRGHAIEVRLYAEDPYHDFLPSIGKIEFLQWSKNKSKDEIRIDSGVVAGDTISPYYDPMIAKLIIWGESREQAIAKMQNSLRELKLIGIKSNQQFLQALLNHKDFQEAKLTTHFIANHQQELLQPQPAVSNALIAQLAVFHVKQSKELLASYLDPFSPWQAKDGWRANLSSELTLKFKCKDRFYDAAVFFRDNHYEIKIANEILKLTILKLTKQSITVEIADVVSTMTIIAAAQTYHVFSQGQHYVIEQYDPIASLENTPMNENAMVAPMPGTIIAVAVKNGERVSRGDKLITMEAMKMEHSLYAPQDGLIRELLYQVGDTVQEGNELLVFEALL